MEKKKKKMDRHEDMGSVLRLETQRVRSHHSSVLHHARRDGPHVLEEMSGLARAQILDVSHDPLVGLRDDGSVKSSLNASPQNKLKLSVKFSEFC